MGEIKNYFRDHGWAVRVPRQLQMHTRAVYRAVDILRQLQGGSPTISDIAEATGLSEEVVYDTFELDTHGAPVSLEPESVNDGSGVSPAPRTRLASEDRKPEGIADEIDLANRMARLDQRERAVIWLAFYNHLTKSEIAERLGMSQMRVSRLSRAAVGKLRLRPAEDHVLQAESEVAFKLPHSEWASVSDAPGQAGPNKCRDSAVTPCPRS